MKDYVYTIACPDAPWWKTSKSPGESINDMQEIATQVNYETMRRHCEGLGTWLLWKGVVTDRHGMVEALKRSYFVSFNKSFYDGIPCYFVDWSGIEFIWMAQWKLDEDGIEARVPPWEVEQLKQLGLEPIDPRTEHLPDFPGISIKRIFYSR